MLESAISPSLLKLLFELTGSMDVNSAIRELFKDAVEHRLEKINKEIENFEKKYGMKFSDFKEAWEKDAILNKYSYEIEKDFWEWEGLISRKRKLEEALKWI